ncbi:MAG: hypothetical protein KDD45_18160, partial [Bdellovibrionales bacterium]|nr:hypothetical protein [Bdellovibrionales bacterium]
LSEIIKPLLKYLCTVDFGKVTYRKDFESFLHSHGLKTKFSERCLGNFFLTLSKFYIYEMEKV